MQIHKQNTDRGMIAPAFCHRIKNTAEHHSKKEKPGSAYAEPGLIVDWVISLECSAFHLRNRP